jgi:hypothetical protein
MNNLKVKTISNQLKGKFDNELEELINAVEDASIQYRTSTTPSGSLTHTALVVYVEKEELTPTAVPTGILPELDDQTTER